MSEAKITVTQKRYTVLRDSKMCPQTKFGILLSNNIGEMIFLDLREEAKIKVTVTRKGYVTLRDPKMHWHTRDSYLNNTGDMLQTLRERSNTEDAKDRQYDKCITPFWGIKLFCYA